MNTKRIIESIEKQNEFLEREIGILTARLEDYRHKADQRGILTHVFVGPASSNMKTKSLERRIAQLTAHLDRNNVRISKLQESPLGSLGQVRHQFGFICGDRAVYEAQLVKDLTEDGASPEEIQKHLRGQK